MHIAIIGATGAVGREVLSFLKPLTYADITLVGSPKSAYKTLEGQTLEPLTETLFDGLDVAIFCTPSAVSKKWAPIAIERGCRVIDNSSAFRMDKETPLIVLEINGHLLEKEPALVAVPNCTTIIALMALYPLHQAFGLERFWASSYQAVSGAGKAGISALLDGDTNTPFLHPIQHNLIPCIGQPSADGYTEEEGKMLHESRKILGLPSLKVSATCVRVPVMRAHSVSIQAAFTQTVSTAEAKKVLSQAPGIILQDNIEEDLYPTPLQASKKEPCFVGRVRKDTALDNGLCFWVTGDQLWKGAALNSVQILRALSERPSYLLA